MFLAAGVCWAVVSPALQRSSAATAARSTRMGHCSLFAHQRDTSRSTCQPSRNDRFWPVGHPTVIARPSTLRVRNPQMTNVIEHRVATAVCRIILHGVVIIHGIFNCKIIDDHRTAGTRRVPCRNTRSVTHAAATRLDHTRLKGSLACGERPHTPGQQTWGRTLCASLGRCFPFEMTCTGRSFGALWSSFRSGRRGRGWI